MSRKIGAVLLIACVGFGAVLAAQAGGGDAAAPLEQAGAQALQDERFGDAFVAFSKAAQIRPADGNLAFGAGYAAARAGRLRDARTWLEHALKLNPRLTAASAVLGQVLYRQGLAAEALQVYDEALRYAPNQPELREQAEAWRKEAQLHGRFYREVGAHFSVSFEGPADDAAARRVVDMLEQAYGNIGRTLSVYPADRVSVILYTQQQFRDITRSPEWASGAYDGRIRVPVAGSDRRGDELRRILEHEFVHALVQSVAGSTVPVWLNEGLATALEPGGLTWAEQILTATPDRVRFEDLGTDFGTLSGARAAVAYAQSARAVKRLLDLRGAPAMVSLLRALGRGDAFDRAFMRAMAMRVDEFYALASRK